VNGPTMDQPTANLAVTFRPVNEEDKNFLLELYASTRAEEMAMVPWSAEQQHAFISMQYSAQQDHYRIKYPDASHDIILAGGRPVGHLHVARLEKEIRIVDVTILPGERNAGFGSVSLKGLLDEAGRSRSPVTIYVEEFNPSLKLFERLGFTQVDQHGIHILMQWSPAPTG